MKGSAIRSSAEEKDPVFLLLRRSEEALFLNPGGCVFLAVCPTYFHTFWVSFVTWLLLLSSNLRSLLFLFIYLFYLAMDFVCLALLHTKKKVMTSSLSPHTAKRDSVGLCVCVCVFSHLQHL